MKIAHISPIFYPAYIYGGPIESVYQLCLALAGNGCEVKVLTTNANGPQAVLPVDTEQEVSLADGLSVSYCQRLCRNSVSTIFLQRLLARVRWADVIHLTAVYSFPSIPTLLACRMLDKPVVWSPRGSLKSWHGTTRLWQKALWERVCQLVKPTDCVLHVTSEEEAEASQQHFPDLRVSIVPNGTTVPDQIDQRVVRPDEKRHPLKLLYLRRLHPIKAIENLIAACHLLLRQGETCWELTIAGAGDPVYTKTLQTLIADRHLARQIRMVGEVVGEAKYALFAQADLIVLPSHTENFGMVVAEALAHGVPVITSTGTPWQRIGEKQCGAWVGNSPEELADAIKTMRGMPLQQMGQNGRRWMIEEFSWQDRAAAMLANYQTLLSNR